MKAVDAFLRQLDDAWSHKWESLNAVLEGVTDAEAEWQAPCYAAEEREDGWPAPGTVRWQVAHVAHCKRYYTKFIRAPGVTERPEADPRVLPRDFAAEMAALRETHAAQRGALAALSDADLGKPVGNGMGMAEFLAMAIRHDTWHAAQIAVARRLYRASGGVDGGA